MSITGLELSGEGGAGEVKHLGGEDDLSEVHEGLSLRATEAGREEVTEPLDVEPRDPGEREREER